MPEPCLVNSMAVITLIGRAISRSEEHRLQLAKRPVGLTSGVGRRRLATLEDIRR